MRNSETCILNALLKVMRLQILLPNLVISLGWSIVRSLVATRNVQSPVNHYAVENIAR